VAVAVASGTLGGRNLEPASDVNLLVTDGDETGSNGYGVPHIASVGGARHLAALAFDDVVTDDARAIARTRRRCGRCRSSSTRSDTRSV